MTRKIGHAAFLLALVWLALWTSNMAADRALATGWDPDQELEAIQRQIYERGETWTAGHTEVSDLPPEAKAAMLGARFDRSAWLENSSGTVVPMNERDLPAYFDWRQLNGMTSAKNQGGCGSCWTFGPTACMESMIKIYTGVDTNLSEQQLLVCSEGSDGCNGGYAALASNWILTMGQVYETCMPYTGNDGAPCVDDECDSVDRIRGYSNVPNDEVALKTAILTGPLAVGIYAPNSFFYYTGGCFQYSGSEAPNHCVTLCGWDDNACSGQGAWLIKNSWGAGWGTSGFGWVRMGDCHCGESAVLLDYVPTPVRLGFDASEVMDNGNHFLDAGESTQLRVTLRNYGRNNATGVTAFLSTATAGITIIDNQATFPDMAAGATGASAAPNFTVQVAPGVMGIIQFDLTINSTQVQNQSSSFPLLVGPQEVFYSAGFEADAQGWTTGGTAGDWRRGSPAGTKLSRPDPRYAARGSVCFGNDLNESGAFNTLYANNQDSWLESPAIDCGGRENIYLAFRRWLTVQKRPSDYARLYVNGIEIWSNPILVHTIGDQWEEVMYDISAYAANNPAVRVRFGLKSSPTISFGGWNIDDVRLLVPAGNPAMVPGDLPRAELDVATYPNPSSSVVNLRVTVPPPGGEPRIRVYDATGRLVRTVEIGRAGPGVHRSTWNGTDDLGRPVPAGAYLFKVSLDGTETSSRVVVLGQ